MSATSDVVEGTHKVGEVAATTGLTVRTLHHYDEIGLVVPSQRSAAGHRRYTAEDLERLYRVCLLRRLGLPLEEIRRSLDDPGRDTRSAMRDHLGEVERRLAAASRLRSRLSQLIAASEGEASDTDLLAILEDMTMMDTTVQRRLCLLVYRDIEAAYDHLTRVFGLGPGELTREDGTVVHGEIEAGDGVIWMHRESPEFGLASPATLGQATASMAVMVDDVDAHHGFAVARGATVEYEPVDQPYGYREWGARDPEGHLWSFMAPLDGA